jgi:TolA-binding protein
MFTPKIGAITKPIISRQEVVKAFETFTRNYPGNERAPDAMYQLAKLRYDGADYVGTVDVAKRAAALYPDNVVTGKILLLEGQAQYRLQDLAGATTTFQTIIANYGSEADEATKLLGDIKAPVAPTGAAGGK